MIIRILDILSAILITLGVFKCTSHRNWWIVYLFGSISFIIVSMEKGLYFLGTMGFITGFSAIRNYLTQRRKDTRKNHEK